MPQTLAIVLPLLHFLAAPAGAGFAASILFAWLRRTFPALPPPQAPAILWRARLGILLNTPRYARLIVLFVSATIGVLCSWLLALATQQPPLATVDAALAGALAAIASQLQHARTLSSTPSLPDWAVEEAL